jgi:hypothetical protein
VSVALGEICRQFRIGFWRNRRWNARSERWGWNMKTTGEYATFRQRINLFYGQIPPVWPLQGFGGETTLFLCRVFIAGKR